MHIILKGKPISTQHAYGKRGRITYMKKEAKELKNSYVLQVRLQHKGKPLQGPVEIGIQLYFNDRRVRDWDNWHKLSMDSLSNIVFDDDSQIKKATVEIMEVDKLNPRIELTICPNTPNSMNT